METSAIVLGVWERGFAGYKMGSPEALALLRCVWRELYLALTRVDLQDEKLYWQKVWIQALKRIRKAVVHRAVEIKRMHNKRKYTKLVDVVSENEAKKYSRYISMHQNGTYKISSALDGAITRAEQAWEQYQTNYAAQRAARQGGAGPGAAAAPPPVGGGG